MLCGCVGKEVVRGVRVYGLGVGDCVGYEVVGVQVEWLGRSCCCVGKGVGVVWVRTLGLCGLGRSDCVGVR